MRKFVLKCNSLGVAIIFVLMLFSACFTAFVVSARAEDVVNLALNKTVTASSSHANDHEWKMDYFTDGKYVAQADSNSVGWCSATDATEWIQVDLGQITTLNQVNLYPRMDDDEKANAFPKNYAILLSDDGANYRTVFTKANEGRGENYSNYNGGTILPQVVNLASATQARYIKVFIFEKNGDRAQLGELTAYNHANAKEADAYIYGIDTTNVGFKANAGNSLSNAKLLEITLDVASGDNDLSTIFTLASGFTLNLYSDATLETAIESIINVAADTEIYAKVANGDRSKENTYKVTLAAPKAEVEGVKGDFDTAIINNTNIAMTVKNEVGSLSFANAFNVSRGASLASYSDSACTSVIAVTGALAIGNNIFYVKVTQGSINKVYTVIITKLPKNIALNKNVVGRSYAGDLGGQWYYDKLTNGTTDNRDEGYSSSSDANAQEWVVIDLEEKQEFNQIWLYPRGENFPSNYAIMVANSIDGEYTPIYHATNIAADITGVVDITFPMISAQFVRIHVFVKGVNNAQILEAEVYNSSVETQSSYIVGFSGDMEKATFAKNVPTPGNDNGYITLNTAYDIELSVAAGKNTINLSNAFIVDSKATVTAYTNIECTTQVANIAEVASGTKNTYYVKVLCGDKSNIYKLTVINQGTFSEISGVKGALENAVLNNDSYTINATIASDIKLLVLSEIFTLSSGITVNAYSDLACTTAIGSTVTLTDGENVFYVKATGASGSSYNTVYTVTVNKYPTNLALGKVATSYNSPNADWLPEHLTDGDYRKGASSGRPHDEQHQTWFNVDLGARNTFNSIIIYPKATGGAAEHFADKFAVMVSDDGIIYNTISYVQMNGDISSLTQRIVFNFPNDIKARHIRIQCFELTLCSESYYMQIMELEVFNFVGGFRPDGLDIQNGLDIYGVSTGVLTHYDVTDIDSTNDFTTPSLDKSKIYTRTVGLSQSLSSVDLSGLFVLPKNATIEVFATVADDGEGNVSYSNQLTGIALTAYDLTTTSKFYVKVINEQNHVFYTITTAKLVDACDVLSVPGSNTTIGENSFALTVLHAMSTRVLDLNVSEGASWELFSDENCTARIDDKTMTLSIGTSKFYVVVTAADNTTYKKYNVTVVRPASAACAVLETEGLTISGADKTILGTVKADIAKFNTALNISVGASYKLFTDSACTAEAVSDGGYALKEGDNVYYVKVTAADNTTTAIYTMTIIREKLPEQPKGQGCSSELGGFTTEILVLILGLLAVAVAVFMRKKKA